MIRFDRKRKDKTLSNKDWESPVDPDSRIAKLKDGRTRLAYKPEHVVDIDNGTVVAAKIHHADKGYHSRNAFRDLDSAFRSRICEPERRGISH